MTFVWLPQDLIKRTFSSLYRGATDMYPSIRYCCWNYLDNGCMFIQINQHRKRYLVKPGDCIIIRKDGTFFRDLEYLPKYEIK